MAANASESRVTLSLSLPSGASGELVDILDGGPAMPLVQGRVQIELFPTWVRVFRLETWEA